MPRLLASAQQCGQSRHVGGVLLDDVQYGEYNTQRRGINKKDTVLAAKYSTLGTYKTSLKCLARILDSSRNEQVAEVFIRMWHFCEAADWPD